MITFGQYIGGKAGKDPGATAVLGIYRRARQEMLADLKSKRSKNKAKDYEELEDYLNGVYFNKGTNDEAKSLYEKFNRYSVAAYNSTVSKESKKLLDGSHVGDYYYTTQVAASELKDIDADMYNRKREYTSRLDVMKRRIDFVKNTLSKIQKTPMYTEEMKTMKHEADYIIKESEKMIKELQSSGQSPDILSKTWLMSWQEAAKLSKKSKYVKSFEAFESLYQSLLGYVGHLDTTSIGKIFEISLGLLNQDIQNRKQKFTEKQVKEITDSFVKGGKRVSYGGRLIQADFETTATALTRPPTKKQVINDKEISMVFSDGSSFSFKPSIDTGEENYSKLDVLVQIPSMNAPVPFRISAKNWDTLGNRSLNHTTILRALDRTSKNNNSLIEAYSYSMQHPSEMRPIAEKSVNYAHNIAKASLLLDIVAGISQGEGYADTLVIMDRKNNRVKVINIIDELEKIMRNDFSTTIDGNSYVRSLFYTVGYDAADIQAKAREMRSNILRNGIRKGSTDRQNSIRYINYMQAYLNSKDVEVHLNKNGLI